MTKRKQRPTSRAMVARFRVKLRVKPRSLTSGAPEPDDLVLWATTMGVAEISEPGPKSSR